MTYRAPVGDIAFALKLAGHSQLMASAFPDVDEETALAILEAAAAYCENELAPLNRIGDQVGSRLENGVVVTPPGFADAYKAFAAGGWNGLSADPEHGGQGLPKALELAVFEMAQAANLAFALCPMLTQAAIEALDRHGTERHRRLILPKMVSGEWTGAMDLTEPQAGSDLAQVACRAEPDGRGGWRVTGQKIFITWGDHDMADNVVHMVLARAPDAPPGVKGISLFMVPKRLIGEDGALGPANTLGPASLEHKLGIHASPTCVMMFEGAQAELVGELNEGLAHMFVMMNAARLQVGVQGVSIAERAFQQAQAYALERRQGRSPWSDEPAARIYDHPDIRRTLNLMRAKIAAGRGICLTTAVLADIARLGRSEEDRAAARARQELLVPIAKAWCTDTGVEVASAALQVHGGMGFIEETGAAQFYRDARIAPIYEGTNGIQAMDLAGRKLADGGAAMKALCADMRTVARDLQAEETGAHLERAISALESATDWMVAAGKRDRAAALSSATAYLKLAGDVIGGWILGREMLGAAAENHPRQEAKAGLARLYASQVLPQAPATALGLMSDLSYLEAMTPEVMGG